MSMLFGKVCQNGYVVRDIEQAMKFWTEVMRVGPFFYIPKVKTDWFRYRGIDSAVEMSIALANSGDLQIELIQQRNDAPSMYLDHLEAHGEGMQHMSYWIDRLSGALRPRRRRRLYRRPRGTDRRPAGAGSPISKARGMPAP